MTIDSISDVLAPGPADGTTWNAGLWAMKGKLIFHGSDALGAGSELYSWDTGALAQPFGIGTDPRIRLKAADPKIGGMAEFSISGAPIHNTLAIAVFGSEAAHSFLLGNERIYVDLLGAQGLAIVLNQGFGSLQFQIPADPSLIGISLVMQAAILQYLNLLGLALTEGMMLTLGM